MPRIIAKIPPIKSNCFPYSWERLNKDAASSLYTAESRVYYGTNPIYGFIDTPTQLYTIDPYIEDTGIGFFENTLNHFCLLFDVFWTNLFPSLFPT